jgi:thiamine-phosphate pyrophosphorylase
MIRYAITDPQTLHFDTIQEDLKRFAQKASMIVYRDKENPHYARDAKLFLSHAKGFEKVLLHQDYLLAAHLGADGVHLMSTQRDDIAKAKALNLFVIISTHTLEEVIWAETLGADVVTFSPVYDTPNKGKAVGIAALKEVVDTVDIPVIALGGIVSEAQIEACEEAGASGFASIRYFA